MPPYDETPDEMTNAEMFYTLGHLSHNFGVSVAQFSTSMQRLQIVLNRASGKNHAAEQLKELQRGMAVFVGNLDEIHSMKPIDIKPIKTKAFTPKLKRIPDREPFYVKLTKIRRR